MNLCIFCLFLFVGLRSALLQQEDRPPTHLFGTVGGYAVFDCPLDFPHGIEIPYILHWIKDGATIFSWYDGAISAEDDFAGRIALLDSGARGWGQGSINLTAIRETDNGWYECKVMFPNRTPNSRNNGSWYHLEVDGGNLIAIPPINQTAMEGSKVQFSCITKQPESFVKWYKDGDAIGDLPDLSTRSWVKQEGSLIINRTVMEDLGEYQCEVVNSLGERQAARAYLNVQYRAKVVYAPTEIFLPYGQSAILDCHFRANPPLTNLRWEKDGFLFDPYNVQGVFYRPNGSLYFNMVDETHAGQYSCTPYNELGTEGPSPRITVIVQRPPSFTTVPHHMYLKKLGDTLELPCDAIDSNNQHRPTILWTKNGVPLPPSRYTAIGGNITIENINEEDRGIYTCSASNEAASITAETELMIENLPPRAPYNLSANSSSNTVTLRWTPGYSSPYIDYNIWYRPVDSAEWRTLKVPYQSSTQTNISSLSSGREYEIMVLCQDKYGDGMFSKSIRIWTKGNGERGESSDEYGTPLSSFMQIGPPKNVSVSLTTEGYLVSWSPPAFGKENLRIYVVRWTQGPMEFLQGSTETKDTNFLIHNLEEDQVYQFQVFAMSFNDYEAASVKVILQVPAYWKIRAVVAGTACSVILLALLVAAAVYHMRRSQKARRSDKLNVDKHKSNGSR